MIVTTQMLQDFRADMAAAMAAVYEKHGLIGSLGKITYSPTGFSAKFEASLRSELPAGVTATAFNPVFVKGTDRHGYAYNVDSSKLGKKFVSRGMEYTFLGINQTGHFAVGKQTRNGKDYKVRSDEMRTAVWIA